jgi:outer membrane receptor protein involved in Fe transport
MVLGCVALWGATASAQDNWWIQAGAFRPSIDSSIRVDDSGSGLLGTNVGFEDGLGLSKRKTLGSILAGMRLGARWRIEAEYFELNRSVNRFALNQTIVVDDTTFPVTALVDTTFDSRVFRIGAGYSFVKNANAEFGLAFGVHLTNFEVGITGTLAGGGASLGRETRDATVPLPTAGLYGSVALAPNWWLSGRADVFSFRHDDFDGRLVNVQAAVTYRFNPNLGLGLGYRYDDYRVDASRDDFSGRFDYQFRGPQVFLEARF